MAITSAAPRITLALRGQILTPRAAGGVVHHRDGLVLADHEGHIIYVGPHRGGRRHYGGPVHDLRDYVLLPGFVDAHVHYPQTRIIGQATGPLLDWLATSVFPEEARYARGPYAHEVAEEMIDRMIGAGTTSAAIFSSSSARATEVLFEHLAERGMRAVAGPSLMDMRSPKALVVRRQPAMDACRRLVNRWHGHDGRLEVAITPRFALSCSRAMLRDAGAFARDHGLVVQTHVGETKKEGELTLEAHRYADHYVDVYDKAGLLGPRTILAHAIHLKKAEWDCLAERGASVAHCPDSNFFLGSGRMRLTPARRRKITVALGSDVAAGRSFSMRRAMASAYDNAMCLKRPVPLGDLFSMATLGGALALGWEDRVGSLEEGKEADVAAFPMPGRPRSADDLLASLVFDNDDPRAGAVWVRGHRLELASGGTKH
jgi:guanine deaminase